jgi:hypothetical protein
MAIAEKRGHSTRSADAPAGRFAVPCSLLITHRSEQACRFAAKQCQLAGILILA